MLTIDRKILNFNIKDVHFSDYPFDIDGCDFLNFEYCKNKIDVKGFTCKKVYTVIIDLTQDLDTIWKNMDNKSARYWIKRAEREGIKFRKSQEYERFFPLYRDFIQKKGLKSTFDAFGVGSTTIETMKKYATLYTGEYDGEILVGTLFLEDNSNIKAWVSASKRLDIEKERIWMTSCADRFVDWEVIKYAKEKGLKEFDQGGLWPKEEEVDENKKGINTYKMGLGGKITTCYSYMKFYSKKYKLLYDMYNLKNLGGKKN